MKGDGDGFKRGKDGVGTESLSESSTESRGSSWSRSSSETSSGELKAKGCSSPSSLLGWPIRKAEVPKTVKVCKENNNEGERKSISVESKFEKLGAPKASGLFLVFEFFFLFFSKCICILCLVAEKMSQRDKK